MSRVEKENGRKKTFTQRKSQITVPLSRGTLHRPPPSQAFHRVRLLAEKAPLSADSEAVGK